jgi:fused signal recognition particle receptor
MGLFGALVAKLSRSHVSDLDWEQAERELLSSDIGPTIAKEVIQSARKLKADDARTGLISVLSQFLSEKPRSLDIKPPLSVFLIVGINGTGKTTSAAKLAYNLRLSGTKVLLGAGDTFRAAAVEQLQTWGTRIGVDVISGKDQSEPASVAFDAVEQARDQQMQVLIVDTAGRLHNKSDLMNELSKIKRVIEKVAPVTEVLLVLDATTGQNAIAQARVFSESVSITGLILTKTDGSAKGGFALAVERELGVPVKFVGTGEAIEDFLPFDSATYLQGLIEE